MTNEKANNMLDDISWFYGGESITTDDIVECRKICHEALEKQIPKKPCSQQENGEMNYYCECGHYLLDETEFELECLRPSFCESCGQAIDWSDAE